LHGAPLAVVVAEGLVDEVEVEVVQAEPGQRLVEGAQSVVLDASGGVVLDPQLGGDPEVLPRDAAGLDGGADGFLVEVGRGGVEVAVPASRAASTAAWVSLSGIWKTPNPMMGISTPLLRVKVCMTCFVSVGGLLGVEREAEDRGDREDDDGADEPGAEAGHELGVGGDDRADAGDAEGAAELAEGAEHTRGAAGGVGGGALQYQ